MKKKKSSVFIPDLDARTCPAHDRKQKRTCNGASHLCLQRGRPNEKRKIFVKAQAKRYNISCPPFNNPFPYDQIPKKSSGIFGIFRTSNASSDVSTAKTSTELSPRVNEKISNESRKRKSVDQCKENEIKKKKTYDGFDETTTLEHLRTAQVEFAKERNWNQYHTPRNLLCALVGEVGELSEIFQWKGEVAPGCPSFSEKEKSHLGEELSDVLLYLIRLADRCHVDLSTAVKDKLKKNAIKYPAQKVFGCSKKYDEYYESN